MFYTIGINNVLCRSSCGVAFLSSARISHLLKLTLVNEVTVSQSVGVVAFRISSEVRQHPTNAKDSVTRTLNARIRWKLCILISVFVVHLQLSASLPVFRSPANSRTHHNDQSRNANPSSVFKQIKNSVY